jgi:hypothetical protein
VVVEAVGLALEQRGALAAARALDRRTGSLVDRYGVHPVDDHAGHAVPRGTVGDVDDRLVVRLRRVLAVAVVLAHEYDRQLVQPRHVRSLVEGAFVACAVAEERARHVRGLAELAGKGSADRDRRATAHDAVGAEHAEVHVRDVHAAALALAVAGRLAEQFGEHAVEGAALGDQMAVAAVRAGDPVLVRQMHHDAGCDGFLAHVQVQGARDLAVLHELAGGFLEQADAHHAPVHVEQGLVRNLYGQVGLPPLMCGLGPGLGRADFHGAPGWRNVAPYFISESHHRGEPT